MAVIVLLQTSPQPPDSTPHLMKPDTPHYAHIQHVQHAHVHVPMCTCTYSRDIMVCGEANWLCMCTQCTVYVSVSREMLKYL